MNAPGCPHTGAALARHLDGDLAPEADELPSFLLTEHLRGCAACQRELQRGRRLDAVLAATAGRRQEHDAGDVRLERILRSAMVQAAPPSSATADQPSSGPLRWPAFALVAAALLVVGWCALSLLPSPSPASSAEPVVDQPLADATTTGATPRTSLPAVDPTPVIPHLDAPIPAPSLQLPRPRPTPAPQPLRPRAEVPLDRVGMLSDADHGRPADLEQAARQLLASGRRDDQDAWLLAAAQLPPSPLLASMLGDARHHAGLLQRLRVELQAATTAGLTDIAAIAVGARLALPDLDQALLRRLRRDPGALEPLAAALRSGGGRADAAAFLLELWRDLGSRGRLDDDEQAARSLFAGGEPALAQGLRGLLERRLQPAETVRCCLALGTLGDPASLPVLLRLLRGPSLPVAVAAAYAIAQLPPAALEELVVAARAAPEDWLLRTALAAAGCRGCEGFLVEAGRHDAESVRRAGHSLSAFANVASLLRERMPTGD